MAWKCHRRQQWPNGNACLGRHQWGVQVSWCPGVQMHRPIPWIPSVPPTSIGTLAVPRSDFFPIGRELHSSNDTPTCLPAPNTTTYTSPPVSLQLNPYHQPRILRPFEQPSMDCPIPIDGSPPSVCGIATSPRRRRKVSNTLYYTNLDRLGMIRRGSSPLTYVCCRLPYEAAIRPTGIFPRSVLSCNPHTGFTFKATGGI